jgi:hypothetical protein
MLWGGGEEIASIVADVNRWSRPMQTPNDLSETGQHTNREKYAQDHNRGFGAQAPWITSTFVVNAAGSTGLAGFFPGNSIDVGTRDADIGQFAIGKAAEFAKTSVIAPPVTVDFHKGGKRHGCLLKGIDAEASASRSVSEIRT